MPTRETMQNGPAVMKPWSPDCYHKQVERYLQDVNIQLTGQNNLTKSDTDCLRDVRVMEMCLRNVMTLDLGWRAEISLEYWINAMQTIRRKGYRMQTVAEFDIIESIAVLSQHFKRHMNKQLALLSKMKTYSRDGDLHIKAFVSRGKQILSLFDLVKEAVAIEALQIKQRKVNVPSMSLIWPPMTTPELIPDPPPDSPKPPKPEFEPDILATHKRQTRWPAFPFK